jgi:thiol-disulfide isomerase/thioredoxin
MVVPVARFRSRRSAVVNASVLAGVAFAGVALLAGCTNSTGGAGDTGYVGTTTTGITNYAAAQRIAAPTLSGTTLDGKKLSLSDYRGKVVVVNVWGSWCSPCRREAPALEETYTKYQSKGVQFLGINVRDDDAAALAFVSSDSITYPSLQDPDETLLLQFKTIVPPTDIPSSIIVDRDGRLAARIIGEVTEPQLVQALDKALGES